MFKKILLPIDLSHTASTAFAVNKAQEIAKMSGGEVHLLYVMPDFGNAMVHEFFPAGFEDKMLQKADADLKAFATENVSKDIKSKTHLAHGHIPEKILETAKTLGADVIVMASHNPDRLRDFLVGSNAERVLRHSPISVLVTRGV